MAIEFEQLLITEGAWLCPLSQVFLLYQFVNPMKITCLEVQVIDTNFFIINFTVADCLSFL